MTTPVEYQGDPKIFIDKDGATIEIKNGNTTMERGVSNFILIALLTTEEPKHYNTLFDNDSEKIKPHYQKFVSTEITSKSLQDRASAAKADLKPLIDASLAKDISVNIENSIGSETVLTITIDDEVFVLTYDGLNIGFEEAP